MNEENQSQDTESPEIIEDDNQAVVEGADTDWKAEVAKYKAIAERKSKQLEKVQQSLTEEKPEVKPDSPSQSDDKYAELEFKQDHPELRDSLELIKILAKGKGISLAEAVKDEDVLDVINTKREKAGVSVINSNSKVNSSSSDSAKKRDRFYKEGGVEALADYLQVDE